MKILPQKSLTFDDVLLVPNYSELRSRFAVDTTSRIADKSLKIPIISANMDTVTEASMAISMARMGALGIIHRFTTTENQADQVKHVKKLDNTIIENPFTVLDDKPLAAALKLMLKHTVSGILVVNHEGKLTGILTKRDAASGTTEQAVSDLMTPMPLIHGGPDTTVAEAGEQMRKNRIEKFPLVNEDGTVAGLITLKDIVKQQEYPDAFRDANGRLMVGAAIGTKEEDLERARLLVDAGVDFIVIDIAHGHSHQTIEVTREIKKSFPQVVLISGNVATYDGTISLLEAGADVVKVGIGAGSICTTRIVTGHGVPQLTAIIESARAVKDFGSGTIIGDGGIRNSGDITKAIAAGAHTVMLGSLLAGTDESPGRIISKGKHKYKVVRGMASLTANIDRLKISPNQKQTEIGEEFNKIVPEGVEAIVPYKGPVEKIIYQLVGGLRSGMTYSGASTISELQEKAIFSEITSAARVESEAHDVELD